LRADVGEHLLLHREGILGAELPHEAAGSTLIGDVRGLLDGVAARVAAPGQPALADLSDGDLRPVAAGEDLLGAVGDLARLRLRGEGAGGQADDGARRHPAAGALIGERVEDLNPEGLAGAPPDLGDLGGT
jgi:hypothetical protein